MAFLEVDWLVGQWPVRRACAGSMACFGEKAGGRGSHGLLVAQPVGFLVSVGVCHFLETGFRFHFCKRVQLDTVPPKPDDPPEPDSESTDLPFVRALTFIDGTLLCPLRKSIGSGAVAPKRPDKCFRLIFCGLVRQDSCDGDGRFPRAVFEFMKYRFTLVGMMSLCLFSNGQAINEIGFIESFALAENREASLQQLVPGTEEYYFFHALHYQNSRQTGKLAEVLAQWAKRFPRSERRRVIERREALQTYEATPQKTLAFLKEELHPELNHIREIRDKKPDLPTRLDPSTIATSKFVEMALASDDLDGLDEIQLENLVRARTPLHPSQLRALLSRLDRPDVDGLMDRIVEDLRSVESKGFGEWQIHQRLLPEQLNQLAAQIPEIKTQPSFVAARIRHLTPGPEDETGLQTLGREAWLLRAYDEVRPLPATFNTLKALIFYSRLQFDLSRGIQDRQRFIEYLKLPRSVPYIRKSMIEQAAPLKHVADLNANLAEYHLGFSPVGNDEALVRAYLIHFAREDADWHPWAEWLQEEWVRTAFAEAKITSSTGNPEKWASLLTPTAYQALKERVDIEFAPTNAAVLAPSDDVVVGVVLKNTPKLIVKLYELNTLSLGLTLSRPPGTDLNLDGLIANSEQTHDIVATPFQRVERTFKFPELTGKRGAWIIEFIGGGKSSRALIQKGQYALVQRTGPAGDLLTVIDEGHQVVTNASAWLDGREWLADTKTGEILIPFSAQGGQRPIILADAYGSFASWTQFQQHAESYRLQCDFHLEREQLLSGREATLMIKTTLMIEESRLAPELLEEPKLTLTTTTLDGVTTRQEIDVKGLAADRVYTHTFTVADRLADVTATITGKMPMLSRGGEKVQLTASREWKLNGIDATEWVQDGHLSRFDGQYRFELLGKNGEAIPDQQVEFEFRHHGVAQPILVPLRSDSFGRIELGRLDQIQGVTAHLANSLERTWHIRDSDASTPHSVHVMVGEPVQIPWTGGADTNLVSLLETRGDGWLDVPRAQIRIQDGYMEIGGLHPGDYSLRLRSEPPKDIAVRVSGGKSVAGWLISPTRALETSSVQPLRIESVVVNTNEMTIQLRHWNAFTRVHVVANRFIPAIHLFESFGNVAPRGDRMTDWERNGNQYSAGREIGDEYRYILERRYVAQYPGNMLPRPSLLLNPWECREAEQIREAAINAGSAPSASSDAINRGGIMGRHLSNDPSAHPDQPDSNLDFLSKKAPLLANLVPDAEGRIRVARSAFGDRQMVQVYAEDLDTAIWKTVDIESPETRFRDLRLSRHLEPGKSFTQSREVKILKPGETLTLTDMLTSEFESYDSLQALYNLLSSLSADTNLSKFSWILQWPKLKDEEKRARYSEFACHEVNFFLSRKDPGFFSAVIRPYLRNKKDKTFLDEYLLELPLERHLEPSLYQRLNAAEKALLAHRLPNEAKATVRHLRETQETLPNNPELETRRFEAALRARGLEEGNGEMSENDTPSTSTNSIKHLKLGEMEFLMNEPGDKKPALATAMASDGDGLAGGKILRDLSTSRYSSYFGLESAKAGRTLAMGRAYYRKVGTTREWAENNYYQRKPSQQGPELIPVNRFWVDYASWDGQSPFLSTHIHEAAGTLSEIMLALGVLDLPFQSAAHTNSVDGYRYSLTASSPMIAYMQQFRLAEPAATNTGPTMLISEAFFTDGDRFRIVGNEQFDKYVTGEFLSGVVYGGHVVMSNPGSAPAKLDILTQIPAGALPVKGSKATQSRYHRLDPYTTEQLDYYFYFPSASAPSRDFAHYPVTLTSAGKAVTSGRENSFHVVRLLSQPDTASWEYVSQNGTDDEVMNWLDHANLEQTDLEKVAWRARNSIEFFRRMTAFLGQHHVWNDPIYRYAVVHDDLPMLRVWLRNHSQFIASCGPSLSSPLVQYDPVEQQLFEHLEVSPLINQRIHRLGTGHTIANVTLLREYNSFLETVAFKPALSPKDDLDVVYYLFVQDRIEEALARFHRLQVDQIETRIQYDYLRCYADFYEEKLADARGLAAQYADHPVDRWRSRFAEVSAQLDEIEGKAVVRPGSGPDRDRQQAELAAAAPTFEFTIEDGKLKLHWKNLKEVTVQYYRMDPELLFSSSPFVSGDSGKFGIIRPTLSQRQPLPDNQDTLDLALPGDFAQANVLVEILGSGQRRVQAHHANTFKLSIAENFGQLELRDQVTGKPVSKAYVKTYAKLKSGSIRFMKDGYTDLRGKFDYASLNSGQPIVPMGMNDTSNSTGLNSLTLRPDEFESIDKISILVLSPSHGAAVREVSPPKS